MGPGAAVLEAGVGAVVAPAAEAASGVVVNATEAASQGAAVAVAQAEEAAAKSVVIEGAESVLGAAGENSTSTASQEVTDATIQKISESPIGDQAASSSVSESDIPVVDNAPVGLKIDTQSASTDNSGQLAFDEITQTQGLQIDASTTEDGLMEELSKRGWQDNSETRGYIKKAIEHGSLNQVEGKDQLVEAPAPGAEPTAAIASEAVAEPVVAQEIPQETLDDPRYQKALDEITKENESNPYDSKGFAAKALERFMQKKAEDEEDSHLTAEQKRIKELSKTIARLSETIEAQNRRMEAMQKEMHNGFEALAKAQLAKTEEEKKNILKIFLLALAAGVVSQGIDMAK